MPQKDPNNKMVLISVHVPKKILDTIDDLVKHGILSSRSEAIRMALVVLLEWKLFSQGPAVMPNRKTDPIEETFRALIVKGR
jgi:Arc/MetJ-type ribon-helix-helix transcriptional regulator